MHFHHLGIATNDADGTGDLFESLLDVPVVHSERFDGLEVRFLELPAGYIELLEPVKGGTVERFLENRGPGIHHVAFESPDIVEALSRARGHGVELIDESPRPGAWGHDVAFLHPDSTGGVLIEFVGH